MQLLEIRPFVLQKTQRGRQKFALLDYTRWIYASPDFSDRESGRHASVPGRAVAMNDRPVRSVALAVSAVRTSGRQGADRRKRVPDAQHENGVACPQGAPAGMVLPAGIAASLDRMQRLLS
ncbi:MAG: hypothetical protein OYG32_09680 [Rhodospirillaceae bacterium]|nr:hypothetical protein [Rhodospirillaceae bacterium]